MRQKIVAGNWKMNKNYTEGIALINKSISLLVQNKQTGTIIFCPPYPYLKAAVDLTSQYQNIHVGAQNCHDKDAGAFTGEISAGMLKSMGVEYVILGHSERRKYFGDNDGWIARKIDIALQHGLKPIFCCGEELDARLSDQQEVVVESQLRKSLFHLSGEEMSNIIIAYEPVWAIGTGHTATQEQAQEMHAFIRENVAKLYTQEMADSIPILYGGSCKPANASNIFSQEDVDGGLIGGSSLYPEEFASIYNQLN